MPARRILRPWAFGPARAGVPGHTGETRVRLAASAEVIDPVSAALLRRFLVRLGLFLLFDLLAGRDQLHVLIGMLDLAAIFTCACAVFTREPMGRGPLNQWDEALAFFALRCLSALLMGQGL